MVTPTFRRKQPRRAACLAGVCLAALTASAAADDLSNRAFQVKSEASGVTSVADVREVLYREGKFDTTIAPGMVIPVDLPANISLRSRNTIDAIVRNTRRRTSMDPSLPSTPPGSSRPARSRATRLRMP